MIDVVALAMVVAVLALGARWIDKDDPSDKHSLFCLGICTHVNEEHRELEDIDPNAPHVVEENAVVIGGPKVIRWKSPAE